MDSRTPGDTQRGEGVPREEASGNWGATITPPRVPEHSKIPHVQFRRSEPQMKASRHHGDPARGKKLAPPSFPLDWDKGLG